MTPVYLVDLATRQAQWAATRQVAISGNIANADSPGYQVRDIEPFASVLQNTSVTLAATEPGHFGAAPGSAGETWDIRETGGPVSLDKELVKADEVNRAFSLDTNVLRAFHRMFMASVRSGA